MVGCFPYAPQLRIKPTTFWCSGKHSNQLSHAGQDCSCFLWQIFIAPKLGACKCMFLMIYLYCALNSEKLYYSWAIGITAKFRFCFYPFQTQLQREKEQDQMKLQAKLEKLDLLEKECFKLTTTQKTAEVSFHLFLWSSGARNKSFALGIIGSVCEYAVNLRFIKLC